MSIKAGRFESGRPALELKLLRESLERKGRKKADGELMLYCAALLTELLNIELSAYTHPRKLIKQLKRFLNAGKKAGSFMERPTPMDSIIALLLLICRRRNEEVLQPGL